jgi:hypothetical protein
METLGGYSEYNYQIHKRAIELRKIVGPCRLERPFKFFYHELVEIAVAEYRLKNQKKLSVSDIYSLECWKVYNGQTLEQTKLVLDEDLANACHYRWNR